MEKKHKIRIELRWNAVVPSKNVVYTIIRLLDKACNPWQCFSRYHIKLPVYNIGQLKKITKKKTQQKSNK